MPCRQLIRWLLCSVLLLSGCQSFHTYRPIAIEARDGETKQPIAGVEVKISYPLETGTLAPTESKGSTGNDGITRVRAAPFGRAGVMVEVSRDGYLSEVKYLSVQEVQAIEPAHWFEDVNQRRSNLVMEMFAGPAPTVEFIAPPGFRGPIKAEVQVRADLPAAAGQRSFSFPVPASGEVVAAGPPLFRQASSANMRVKFADDRQLSFRAKDSALGYWYVKYEGRCYHFFVGTPSDYESYCKSTQNNAGSSKGQSEGKGRRGRKSDSNSFGANP
jgi:hypothetical protein